MKVSQPLCAGGDLNFLGYARRRARIGRTLGNRSAHALPRHVDRVAPGQHEIARHGLLAADIAEHDGTPEAVAEPGRRDLADRHTVAQDRLAAPDEGLSPCILLHQYVLFKGINGRDRLVFTTPKKLV